MSGYCNTDPDDTTDGPLILPNTDECPDITIQTGDEEHDLDWDVA